MRILIVTSRYLPNRGGLETAVSNLCDQVRSQGHEVLIITNRYPRYLPKQEKLNSIHVFRLQFLIPLWRYLGAGRLDLFLASLFFFPFTTLKLAMLIQRFKPDVVNLHYLGLPGFFIWVVSYLIPFRFVVSLHGGDVDGEPYQSRFNRWLFLAALRQADRITTCSQALLDQVQTLAPNVLSKAQVIHNGVAIDEFADAAPYLHPRPYVFAVGQLEYHKGFDVLITAFAQTCGTLGEVDLLIAGDGNVRNKLQAQIQDENLSERVHLLRAVNRSQVASLMQGSLAVAIPSRREPFGIVALEAMATGKPIIVSHVGGLPEALTDAKVTWVQPGDPAGLAEALTTVIKECWDDPTPSEVNKLLAEKRAWREVANRYLAVLAENQ